MIEFQEFPKEGVLEGALATNNSWSLGCPGIPGKDYWDCLKAWGLQKFIILRMMKKDLRKFNEDEGNEAASLVMSIVTREIAVAYWQADCGPIPIWRGIFSRAKGKAKKNLTGKSPLDDLNKGIFKHATKDPRSVSAAKFGLQDTSSRPGIGTGGIGSHDAIDGRH